jgi:hypothetical protein
MLDLAGALARRWPNMLRPPPPGLVGRPTHGHRTDRIETRTSLSRTSAPQLGRRSSRAPKSIGTSEYPSSSPGPDAEKCPALGASSVAAPGASSVLPLRRFPSAEQEPAATSSAGLPGFPPTGHLRALDCRAPLGAHRWPVVGNGLRLSWSGQARRATPVPSPRWWPGHQRGLEDLRRRTGRTP